MINGFSELMAEVFGEDGGVGPAAPSAPTPCRTTSLSRSNASSRWKPEIGAAPSPTGLALQVRPGDPGSPRRPGSARATRGTARESEVRLRMAGREEPADWPDSGVRQAAWWGQRPPWRRRSSPRSASRCHRLPSPRSPAAGPTGGAGRARDCLLRLSSPRTCRASPPGPHRARAGRASPRAD